ncbi:MAG TPA: cupin domain-containing protein [Patescibacteria group bacterium]|nr:cupin domain-containing protein [Patescibacteria group bacterium]
MAGYFGHIEDLTLKNSFFRQVVFTGKHTQLVLMSLKPGEEIGAEVHTGLDQFFRFEKGSGKVVIEETEYLVKDGDVVIVPGGSLHNIINTSDKDELKLYTLYSPPNHPERTIHKTKDEAVEAEKSEHH